MVYNWNSWKKPLHYNSYFFIILGVLILLVGFAFRFPFNISSGFSQFSDTPIKSINVSPPPPILSSNPQGTTYVTPRDTTKECNLFIGDWVPNKSEPFYTNETCSFIFDSQNCMKNGRSDTSYLYWKWKPRGCELPQFDPKRFLVLMSNKVLGLIGDSISMNHVQSLLCLLSTVEKAVLVYNDQKFKSRRWIFPSYNFTVSNIWSPLLAKANIYEDSYGVSSSEIELHLDILDNSWTEQYRNLDYMILTLGKWILKSTIYYENNTVIGCHYCPKRNFTELDTASSYRKILKNVFNYIVESNHKGTVFYRTSTPDHFENGEWYSGGTCNRTVPANEGDFKLKEYEKIIYDIEVEEFDKASSKASENGVNIKLFDMTYVSLLRPDGHPGLDRYFQKFSKDQKGKSISDCLHWCVPGPIDYWNDLLMEIIVNG